MFGKALDVGAKRDVMGAVTFYAAHVVVLAGISTVLVHVLGMLGVVDGSGSFFAGGETFTLIGSIFVLWLGGMTLHARGMSGDILSVLIVVAGTYLAWDQSVLLGLVPIALLTTIHK